MSGITIGNNRRQVIDVLPTRKSPAVVVLQGLEELVDLLRDRIIRIVREVGTGFIRRGRRRRALPSRNIDGRELGRHGRGLDGVEGAVGARVAARGRAQVQSLEELLGRRVLVRRFALERAAHGHHILGGVGPFDALPAGLLPLGLERGDLRGVHVCGAPRRRFGGCAARAAVRGRRAWCARRRRRGRAFKFEFWPRSRGQRGLKCRANAVVAPRRRRRASAAATAAYARPCECWSIVSARVSLQK